MKNLNLIVIVLATLLFGCKKDEEAQVESLIGTWELRHVYGVQVAGAPADFEDGNGNIIQFSSDEYQMIADGKVVTKGTYSIVKIDGLEIDGTAYQYKFVFDGDTTWNTYFKLSGNTLAICVGSVASDGTTSTYEKK